MQEINPCLRFDDEWHVVLCKSLGDKRYRINAVREIKSQSMNRVPSYVGHSQKQSNRTPT